MDWIFFFKKGEKRGVIQAQTQNINISFMDFLCVFNEPFPKCKIIIFLILWFNGVF